MYQIYFIKYLKNIYFCQLFDIFINMSKEYKKQWYQANKERLKAKQKDYNANTVDKRKEYKKSNKDKIRIANKEYYNKNKDIINEKRRAKVKEKFKTDLLFRLKHNVRSGINRVFKTTKLNKLTKSEVILGCDIETFKNYIESQFESWMNWDNYGLFNSELNYGWDLDHIIPLSSAKTIEDIIRLCHYTNYKPLCSYVNRHIKRNKPL